MRPPSAPCGLLNSMTFGDYNRAFPDAETGFDWLSRDRDEVQAYVDDPYCGEVMSAHFFRELIRGACRVNAPDALRASDRETSLLLLSGAADPVGGFGTGVRTVVAGLQQAGHPAVELKQYDGARHELLHETNREDVLRDIGSWLEMKISACQNGNSSQE